MNPANKRVESLWKSFERFISNGPAVQKNVFQVVFMQLGKRLDMIGSSTSPAGTQRYFNVYNVTLDERYKNNLPQLTGR